MGRLVRVVHRRALLMHASAQVVCLLRLSKLGCQFTDTFQVAVRYCRVWARYWALNPLELSVVVLQKVTLVISSAVVEHRLIHMIKVLLSGVCSHV